MFFALLFAAGAALVSTVQTEGWKSSPSARRISDPNRAVIWRVPVGEGSAAFDVDMRDGAKGEVRFSENSVIIDKSNDVGLIVVRPTVPYQAKKEMVLRTAVRVECVDARPLETTGRVYLYSGKERLSQSSYDMKHWSNGGDRLRHILNTPPNVGEWKYGHDLANKESGFTAVPAIVVSGAACKTTWSDWRIEDVAEVEKEWGEIMRSRKPPDRISEMISAETFKKMVECDVDHVAKVAVRDGRSVLLVDGKVTMPFIYKSRGRGRAYKCVHAGRGIERAGVKLHSMMLSRHWWPNEKYGVASAVDEVSNAMRTAPDSLFIVAINLNPHDRFAEKHPSERWIGRDGMIVCGGGGACLKAVKPGEPWPKGMVPCTSYSSIKWRDLAKKHISDLVAELKRLGLSKRIVGVHLTGFHDGQFSNSHFPDFSPCALESFRRYTGNPNANVPNFSSREYFDVEGEKEQKRWLAFVKTEVCRVLNDIGRHVKKCFAKDIVVVRWSYGPYSGKYINDYDTQEFFRSDALDILVAQQAYEQRGPAIPFANKIPFESYHRHGKMYLDELDFRTWNVVRNSEVSLLGLSCSMDISMWKPVIRRGVGRMMAGDMGWWFYDMENGWFDHPAILEDVSDMLREIRAIPHPGTGWRPSAAIVIDEISILENVNLASRTGKNVAATYRERKSSRDDLSNHLPKFAASGVPSEVLLAEDLFENPTLADAYKAIAWTCCVRKDGKRAQFEKMFAKKGGRILSREDLCVSTAESLNRFARDAGAYVPIGRSGLQVDMKDGFISLHCIIPGRYDFQLPYPAKVVNLKTGLDVPVKNNGKSILLDMEAGESRWYSFVPLKE